MSVVANRAYNGCSRTVQAFWLALANLLSVSATFIIAAVLSRVMPPDDYGTYRQVIFVYYTLLIVFSCGLPRAYSYFLARVPIEEGRDVVCRLNIALVAFASIFSASLFFGADVFAHALGNLALAPNLRYFAVTPMLLMPVLGVESILTVYGKTGFVAVYALISRFFMIAGAVVPVIVFDAGVSGAVLGFVAASALSCAAGWKLAFLPFRGIVDVKTSISFREVASFVLPVFASGIYGFVIASSSQFFVSRFFGVEAFAVFANGYKELPFANMAIVAVGGVLLPEFSRMFKERTGAVGALELYKGVIVKSASLVYPLSIFCGFFALEIVIVLYGVFYSQSAILFMLVTVVNLLRIVPCGSILFATGNGGMFAKAHMATAVIIVMLDMACVCFFPSLWAIALIGTCCTVCCILWLMRGLARTLGVTFAALMPWWTMLKILVASIAACMVVKLLCVFSILPTEGLAGLAVASLTCIVVFIPIARLFKLDYSWLLALAVHPLVRLGLVLQCRIGRIGRRQMPLK